MADTSKLIRYFEASGSGEEARRMLDLAEQVVKGRPYRVADFTSPAGLVIADAIKANYPQLIVKTDGGYEGAERIRIAFVDSDFNGTVDMGIRALKVNWDPRFRLLTHRDVLGSLMGLGIDRSKFGDVIVQPALAQANVGVAMNSGTQAAKEAGNMVDLDNDPTKLIEIVEIGKQLLMTRGTLTTFSIANDVAKYFAIVPALFMVAIPELAALNIMQLHSPESAILSAVIFNAIIIPILIPLALRGVQYKPIGASALLRRNLLIYGVGGVIAPFIGIKLIDLLVGLFF